ncbi:PEP-CTERM sorting domain-containing protein [Paludisphaera mucosa]|uniref:PEP-CTERM sorting domain-containing protein n=1 Tax=Paludisphaera mucosa TaxID=3030827 RepID=A0ABT6FBW7_9BACT|nr:PEP-CTERM sorting domain-containing protein [Paludisphaera mucosa]MDG3004939.1 PEP-CTERM sorting domain-containing protein [Paludisphaera mucosa]
MRGRRCAACILFLLALGPPAEAGPLGFADVVLDYFDSGAGPLAGPYGGTFPDGPGFPIPVSLDVVLGDDPGPTGFTDFLSLPMGSYITVGFTDEVIFDGVGDDVFIREVGASGERAEVYVSPDGVTFTLLGIAQDDVTTALDLAAIGYTDFVRAVKIVGLDNFGGSPGFDVVSVQGLPQSVSPSVPEPGSLALLAIAGLGFAAVGSARRLREVGRIGATSR